MILPTLLLLILGADGIAADEPLRISGSPAIAPVLDDIVAEAGLEDVVISPRGTVRGFEELCREGSVGVIGTTRAFSAGELATCAAAGIDQLTEMTMAMDGIVLAQSDRQRPFALELRELFLASATLVPDDDRCILMPNPNESWDDVDADLPSRPIRIYGPPSTSGTRSMFVEMAIAEGARQIECLAELERRDPAAFERAIMPRRDEVWLDAGDSDAALAMALRSARDAVGIFGWQSFEDTQGLSALPLEGIAPDRRSILMGRYPLGRPLFLYVTPEALTEPRVRSLVTRLPGPAEGRPVRRYSTSSGEAITTVGEGATSRVRVYRTGGRPETP